MKCVSPADRLDPPNEAEKAPKEDLGKIPVEGLCAPAQIVTKKRLCSNPDIAGARKWLITALAKRALEIIKEQDDAKN